MTRLDWDKARREALMERPTSDLPVLGSKAPSPRPVKAQRPVGRATSPLDHANRRPLRTDNGR
jgi:hypothetical protein